MRAGLVAVMTAAASWLLLSMLLRSGWAARIAVDTPNERSLHSGVVPRVGGLIVVGTSIAVISIVAPALQLLAVAAVSVLAMGAIDDRLGLRVSVRLAIHIGVAAFAAFTVAPAAPVWLQALMVVAIVWSMNLYNFMDGADGLAGGMTAIGFGALSLAALAAGAPQFTLATAAISGAAVGFLFHNFPPARVFLGDAGSVPLGFLAATIGIAGWAQGVWPAWFPPLVFSPFIFDASVTVIRRALRGARIWHAHREHLYQQMVTGGFGHLRTAIAWYVVMGVVAASAIAALRWSIGAQIAVLSGWLAIYAALYVGMGRWIRVRAHEG